MPSSRARLVRPLRGRAAIAALGGALLLVACERSPEPAPQAPDTADRAGSPATALEPPGAAPSAAGAPSPRGTPTP